MLFRLDGYFVRGPRVLPHPQEQVVAVLLRVLNYVDYYCHYHYVPMILLSTRRLDPRRIRQNERHGTTVLDALMKSSYDPSSDAPRHVGSFFCGPTPFLSLVKVGTLRASAPRRIQPHEPPGAKVLDPFIKPQTSSNQIEPQMVFRPSSSQFMPIS